MRRGWVFLAPLGVLVWTLIISNWEAGQAGMLAVAVTFGVGALQKETRPTWRGIMETLEGTGRTMLDLVAITTLAGVVIGSSIRSEEHTSELQSRQYLVCRLLLEKKKNKKKRITTTIT